MHGKPSYRGAYLDRGGFKRSNRSTYGFINSERENEIMKTIERDWNRQPELRAQYNNSFEKYVRSIKSNVTFS